MCRKSYFLLKILLKDLVWNFTLRFNLWSRAFLFATKIAFLDFEKQSNLNKKIFVVAGGVAANKKIRSMLINLCKEKNYESIFPPIELCGDNAAMIGMVGLEKFKLNQFNDLDYPAKPRWPLDEKANFLKGAGVKL